MRQMYQLNFNKNKSIQKNLVHFSKYRVNTKQMDFRHFIYFFIVEMYSPRVVIDQRSYSI